MFLHPSRSLAAGCASPQTHPQLSAVLHQVILGWPCFLLPGGVHLRGATLRIPSSSIRTTVCAQAILDDDVSFQAISFLAGTRNLEFLF